MAMDMVDYTIFGGSMQFVEIELDPDEAAVGEPGAMMYMENGLVMDTIFGDGSPRQQGFMNKLMGAGRRLLTGESMFTTIFRIRGRQAKNGFCGTLSRDDPAGRRRHFGLPKGCLFFQRLSKEHLDTAPALLATHPHTADRLEVIDRLLAQMGPWPVETLPFDWPNVRAQIH